MAPQRLCFQHVLKYSELFWALLPDWCCRNCVLSLCRAQNTECHFHSKCHIYWEVRMIFTFHEISLYISHFQSLSVSAWPKWIHCPKEHNPPAISLSHWLQPGLSLHYRQLCGNRCSENSGRQILKWSDKVCQTLQHCWFILTSAVFSKYQNSALIKVAFSKTLYFCYKIDNQVKKSY